MFKKRNPVAIIFVTFVIIIIVAHYAIYIQAQGSIGDPWIAPLPKYHLFMPTIFN